MYEQVKKPKENKSRAIANTVTQKRSDGKQSVGFVDNRPHTTAQRKVQELLGDSQQAKQQLIQKKESDVIGIQDIRSSSNGKVFQGRFFEKQGDNYTWHEEAPNERYKMLGEQRYYYSGGVLNPLNLTYGKYPVYTREALDRHGNYIKGGLTDEEQATLDQIQNVIAETPYAQVLDFLSNRITENLGQTTLHQFYKGAHIIFNDVEREVYNGVFDRARPVIKLRNRGMVEWISGVQLDENPQNLAPSTAGGVGMGARRPESGQTSHYERDDLPQLGIDLPNPLTGHILIGVVPDNPVKYGSSAGCTFVQTEMYGFKTYYDKYIGHVKGFAWNKVGSYQSGLVGYSTHSEKSGTEIREQDNPHVRAIWNN